MCVIYAIFIYGYYSRYLDAALRYIPPRLQSAREDILGFGFLFTWLIVFVIFGISNLFVYLKLGAKEIAASTALFLILTVVDYFLWSKLVPQVPM